MQAQVPLAGSILYVPSDPTRRYKTKWKWINVYLFLKKVIQRSVRLA